MSERKVLNKYFPPDFDPSKIPRRKMPKDRQETVRLMAPFSMVCKRCHEFIYKGKKFNARKEQVDGERYLDVIALYRFYIKCPTCSSEITFKTDPKNTDYTAEHGATRLSEPWKDRADEKDAEKIAREEEDTLDPMKAAENRMKDAQRTMEVDDALADVRSRNARMERVDTDELMTKLMEEREARDMKDLQPEELERLLGEEEDEKLVRKLFSKVDYSQSLEVGAEEDEGEAEDSSYKSASTESKPPSQHMIIKRKKGDAPSITNLISEEARAMLPPRSTLSKSTPATSVVKPMPSLSGPPAKKVKVGGLLGVKIKAKAKVV